MFVQMVQMKYLIKCTTIASSNYLVKYEIANARLGIASISPIINIPSHNQGLLPSHNQHATGAPTNSIIDGILIHKLGGAIICLLEFLLNMKYLLNNKFSVFLLLFSLYLSFTLSLCSPSSASLP